MPLGKAYGGAYCTAGKAISCPGNPYARSLKPIWSSKARALIRAVRLCIRAITSGTATFSVAVKDQQIELLKHNMQARNRFEGVREVREVATYCEAVQRVSMTPTGFEPVSRP